MAVIVTLTSILLLSTIITISMQFIKKNPVETVAVGFIASMLLIYMAVTVIAFDCVPWALVVASFLYIMISIILVYVILWLHQTKPYEYQIEKWIMVAHAILCGVVITTWAIIVTVVH